MGFSVHVSNFILQSTIFFYLGQNVFSGKQFKTATYFWQQPYAVDFPPASLLYICRKLL